MAGRPKGSSSKTRTDKGTKRGNYHVKHDPTGKTFKENAALKSFWSTYKMADIIQLSSKELDIKIEEWLEEFQATQIKRHPFWWYPEINYDPTPKVKKEKKINTKFNSSFRNK